MSNEDRIIWIRKKLNESLTPNILNIRDDSHKHAGHEGAKSGAGHFFIEIESPAFENQPLIKCHRMIYDALESAIPHEIHALKIKIIRP